jgi:hypothetical protein
MPIVSDGSQAFPHPLNRPGLCQPVQRIADNLGHVFDVALLRHGDATPARGVLSER